MRTPCPINAVLQMFGMNVLPIQNDDISNIISVIFLIVTAAWNTWKNRNFTKASQEAQALTDMIKNGEILIDQIEDVIQKFKDENKG